MLRKKIWLLCEAFTLVGDRTTVGDSLTPWAGVYPDRRTCLGALEQAVRTRVEENLEGSDPDPDEIDILVDEVMSHAVDYGHQSRRYTYSCEDREVVWRVYPVTFGFPVEEEPQT